MKSMMPEASFLMQHLLRDGAWFARIVGALIADDGVEDIVEMPIPPPQSTDEAVTHAEIRLRVVDAALRLSEPFRSAVLLRFLEGESIHRMTALTHTPREIVRVQVRCGVAQLKEVLELR